MSVNDIQSRLNNQNDNLFQDHSITQLVTKLLYAPSRGIDKIIDVIAIELFDKKQKQRALVLTAKSDHNGALALSPISPDTLAFQKIDHIYDTTYKRFSNENDLCKAIDLHTSQNEPILLVIRGHGNQKCIAADKDVNICVGDPLPKDSCFKNLPPKSVVILESCSTGKGGASWWNFANFIAEYVSSDVRIFSATEDINFFTVTKNDPLEVRFIRTLSPTEDCTYVTNGKTQEKVKTEDFNYNNSISEDSFANMESAEDELSLARLPSDATHSMDADQTDDVLATIQQNLIEIGGQITGIKPAIEELNRLHEIMVVLAKNPAQGPVKIVSELLKTPENKIKNLLQSPQNFLQKGELFLKDPAANYWGALAACGSLLTFMESVTWVINFMRDPKHMAKATLKMPITTMQSVIKLGIGLIRHPEKTAISFCKSLIKAPVNTVNGFLRAVGLKKRKKRKAPPQPPSISPQEKARIVKKYLADLTALYGYAKGHWLIDPFKTIEEYHYDLQKDWESGPENRMLCKDFSHFPLFLKAKFEQEDFYTIKRLSPRAHPKEIMPPIEAILAYEEIEKSLQKVQMASKLLDAASQAEAAAIQELNVERTKLHNKITQLSTFIDNNEDKIKKALRAKMNKNKQ